MEKICPECGQKVTHTDKINNTDYVCPYCYSKFEVVTTNNEKKRKEMKTR